MDTLPADFFILDDETNYETNDINTILTPQQKSNLAKGFGWENDSAIGNNNNISSQHDVANFDAANENKDIIPPPHLISTITTQEAPPTQVPISFTTSTDSSRTANGHISLVSNDAATNSNNNNPPLVYNQINPQFVVYSSSGTHPVASYPFQYQSTGVPFVTDIDVNALLQEYTLRAFSKHSLLTLHAEIAEILKTYEANRVTNNVNLHWIQNQVSSPTKSVVLIHFLIQELQRMRNMQQQSQNVFAPQFYYPPQPQPSTYGQYQEPASSTVAPEVTSTIPSQPMEIPHSSTNQPIAPHPPQQQPDRLLPSVVKKIYPCPYSGCTKSFDRKSRLRRHSETHLENRQRYFCTEKDCDKSYATKWDLIQHQREKHQIISALYVCPFKDCDEKFEIKKAWEEHIKQHKQDILSTPEQQADLSRVVFTFSGTLSRTRSELTKLITDRGGQVQKTVSHKVTHLISTPADVANESSQVKVAKKRGIFIVSENFLLKCLKAGHKVPEKDYLLVPHEEHDSSDKNGESSSPSFKKHKAEDDNGEHSIKPD